MAPYEGFSELLEPTSRFNIFVSIIGSLVHRAEYLVSSA